MAHDGGRLAVFAPVNSTGRVDAVFRRLTNVISLGLLRDGEQLPSESELAGQLGVSTVTLREALMALRQQGLLETRRGRRGGNFVRVPATPIDPDLGTGLRGYSTHELRDFGDHYMAVASAVAFLAARRALPSDIAPLRRSLAEMSGAQSPAEHGRLDGRFHLEIAAASQSARLAQEEISLQAELGALMWAAHEQAEGRDDLLRQHQDMVEAIASGAAEQAQQLAGQHVLNATAKLVELRLLDGEG
jgi:DNA-binding FadR family transcriptional regulator